MRKSLALAFVVAAVPSAAAADNHLTGDQAVAAAEAVVGAFADADQLRAAFAAKVDVDALGFADKACDKAFGGKHRVVTRKQHRKLAACLAGAAWRPAVTRQIDLRNEPTGWRLAGVIPDAGEANWLEIKLDERDQALAIRSIEMASVGGVMGDATPGIHLELVQPVQVVPVPATPPPPAAHNIPPTALEALRIKGSKNITPDDVTKAAIVRSGKAKVVGSFKLCVDVAGNVSSVNQLKSTGFPDYDKVLQAGIKTWQYKPVKTDAGAVVPACTAVTFIYSP